jgi:hypothetical protein
MTTNEEDAVSSKLWTFLTVVSLLMLLAVAPAAFTKEGADLGPGCSLDRPAIAHHAGGVIAHPDEDQKAPIPCSTATGYRTTEISIVITNEGSILLQPAFPKAGLPIGVVRSVDHGATWDFIDPKGNPPRTSSIDMNMWIDRRSGRVFWSNDLGPLFGTPPQVPPRVDYTDDDGKTWIPSSPLPDFHYIDTQIVSGPPTSSLEDLTSGSPNPVYVCTAGSLSCPLFNFCGKHCTKSLDGGTTFGPASAVPFPPECPFPGVHPTGAFGLNGVVGRDGTVYQPLTPCERPYIAVSHDEGSTWQLVLVADTETTGWGELALGMDNEEHLYAAWTGAADRLLYLAISRDHGLHWSRPMMIAAPGVNEAAEPQLVAGVNGQVAVAYYGSKNAPVPFPPDCVTGSATVPNLSGNGVIYTFLVDAPSLSCPGYEKETWDTYITETWNALGGQPLFWSATLNDPDKPTWFGATPSGMREAGGWAVGHASGAGNMDYFGLTMAPDNTAWVGFVQECPFGLPVAGNPNCSQAVGGPNDGEFAMVGRLISVPREVDGHGGH